MTALRSYCMGKYNLMMKYKALGTDIAMVSLLYPLFMAND